jgi:CheY-like chemotaxis protein
MGVKMKTFNIIIAEDDDDDFFLTQKAFTKCEIKVELTRVCNGKELIEILTSNRDKFNLVLLDLNMPVMDGREALQKIRTVDSLRCIPIIALTTSNAELDIKKVYSLGANSFMIKPDTYKVFAEKLNQLIHYWSDTVELPLMCD